MIELQVEILHVVGEVNMEFLKASLFHSTEMMSLFPTILILFIRGIDSFHKIFGCQIALFVTWLLRYRILSGRDGEEFLTSNPLKGENSWKEKGIYIILH